MHVEGGAGGGTTLVGQFCPSTLSFRDWTQVIRLALSVLLNQLWGPSPFSSFCCCVNYTAVQLLRPLSGENLERLKKFIQNCGWGQLGEFAWAVSPIAKACAQGEAEGQNAPRHHQPPCSEQVYFPFQMSLCVDVMTFFLSFSPKCFFGVCMVISLCLVSQF